jgi:NitT/TauT family transport system ATP-binding protein
MAEMQKTDTSRMAGGNGSSPAIPKAKVELKNVCKGYGDDWERQEVVADFNLTIEPGLLTAVVGPSGCGKSTLVNLVAGFEKADSGEILVNGKPIEGPSHDRMVVFQESALMPWLTAYQNVLFGPKLRGDIASDQLAAEANQILETVGLAEFKDKYPLQLSGGMQRRAELARAMINRPSLMIMDEPFRGLDAMSRELMQEFYLRLFEKNRRTNLFVTSEIEEAIFLADNVVVLSTRPTTVRAVIRIDLPRPRDFNMLSSPEVYEYKRQAMEILHEEALKSFKLSGVQADFVEAYSRRNN